MVRSRRDPPAFSCLLPVIVTLAVGLMGSVAGAPALAHGIAGNRLFAGTLTFDDPAVADEFSVTSVIDARHPSADGSGVVDDTIAWSFVRLLTPTLAVGVDSGFVHRNWGEFRQLGFDTTSVFVKSLLYKDEPRETLISGSLTWGIGGSGALGVGAGGPHALQPGIFAGQGFGNLPDSLAWLRPFGIAAGASVEFPLSPASTILGIDPGTGRLTPMPGLNVTTLHWGFAIEYSTYYLTDRFTGAPPKEEPLRQFVPLVEFAFDTPVGQKTAATVNPGLAYVGDTFQVAFEAMVPLNTPAGHGFGVRTQLLLFIDDLMPSVFGKPLLSR